MSSAWEKRQFTDDRPGVYLVISDIKSVRAGRLHPPREDAAAGRQPTLRRWPRHPRSVARARTELLKSLSGWGLTEIADAAVLVLSELLTNAVRHAHVPPGRQIGTRFLRTDTGVRIEVHDAGEGLPEIRRHELDSSGGRGLLLVAALADAWNAEPRDGIGKVVWAEINLSASEGGCDGA
ncbi:ATP-binding protein [Streptomyces sp. NPDC020096]